MSKLTETLLNGPAIPPKFADVRGLRKPDTLPDNATPSTFTDDEVAYLDSLPFFEVDGQDLSDVTFPPGISRLVMVDFTTDLPWLVDTAGFDYPRYVMSIEGYRPGSLAAQGENEAFDQHDGEMR